MVTCLNINYDSCGLFGNKLFIIAAAIGLAKRNNTEVVLPKFKTSTDWMYGHVFENHLKTSNIFPIMLLKYKEPNFHYTSIPYESDLNIDGYFQSEKYFVDSKDEVQYYFEPNREIINNVIKRFPMVLNEECISIHIRRGDYLNHPHHYPPTDIKYYQEAIETLKQPDKYLVFSDDIEWCRKTFQSENNDMIFIEGQKNYEDMFLMSLCKNHITANSSFSWWGAWLNKNKDKKVIMPKKWFGISGPQDWQDIYPEGNNVIII